MLFTTASKHFIGTLEKAHNRCVTRVAGAGMWARPGACLQGNGWAPSPVSLQSPAFPTDPHKLLQTQIQKSPLDYRSYPKIPCKAVERKGKKTAMHLCLSKHSELSYRQPQAGICRLAVAKCCWRHRSPSRGSGCPGMVTFCRQVHTMPPHEQSRGCQTCTQGRGMKHHESLGDGEQAVS